MTHVNSSQTFAYVNKQYNMVLEGNDASYSAC